MAIFTGVWWDHATHKLILTLGPKAAGFLSAAIVTWVNIVAVCTWPIIRYVLYSTRLRPAGTADVYHHQTQVTIRNSQSAAQAASAMLQMIYGYRKRKVSAFLRNAMHLVLCVVIFVLWTLCGLYAPYIYTKAGSDVLLAESPHCGPTILNTSLLVDGNDAFTLFQKNELQQVNLAEAYAQQCYNTTDSASCLNYPRQSLPFNKTTTGCPFGEYKERCATVNSTTIQLDTGLLDSNIHFGINAPSHESLAFRRVATCSPVDVNGTIVVVNTTGTALASKYPPGEVLFEYMFGPTDISNYTFQYSRYSSLYESDYALTTFQYEANSTIDNILWQPNATLYAAQDADVTIASLSANAIDYFHPVYDPVFAAGLNLSTDTKILNSDNLTVYISHSLINVVACTEQFQVCLPGSKNGPCTPLVGVIALEKATFALMKENNAVNFPRLATLNKLGLAAGVSGIGVGPIRRGGSILLASKTLNGVLQTAMLPENQWELELENWNSIALAKMQAYMLDFVTGPADPTLDPFVATLLPQARKASCRTQRVRNMEGHFNFDMVGLIVLTVVGAILMLVGLTFELLVAFLAKHNAWLRERWSPYLADGLYQVQKAALEANGVREWDGKEDMLPTSTQYVEATGSEEMVSRESLLYAPK